MTTYITNIGLLATPWFEGRLAQCLADILGGSETAARMALLVLAYILTILVVQAAGGDPPAAGRLGGRGGRKNRRRGAGTACPGGR